jgi:hypothetical protein
MSQIKNTPDETVAAAGSVVLESGAAAAGEAEDAQTVAPFRLPKVASVKTLAKQLEDKFALSPEAAYKFATAVEDPSEVRRQLPFPGRVRVPGGTLLTITARVSAYGVVPHPVNGRILGATAYPAAAYDGAGDPKFWAERDLAVGGPAELVLTADTAQTVVDALNIMSRELHQQNDLTESISEHGVYFPVCLVALRVKTAEGREAVALSAFEGSSRTASTHRILGIESADPLFGSIADWRVARQRMQGTQAALELPVDEVDAKDLARARASSVPAIMVVGYEADAGSGVALVDALDSYVSFLHLDPPKEWTEPAKENKLADYVVDTLLEAGFLTQKEAEWYAGMLPPQEASAAGLSEFADERAAQILRRLSEESWTPVGKAVGRGVKKYTLKKRADKNPKALAAASLALRAHSSARKKETTSTLSNAFEYRGFWNRPWKATTRSPEELRDAALSELVDDVAFGPATLELAARGAYYLVTTGVLGSPEPGSEIRTSDGKSVRKADKRYPHSVMAEIVRSAQGVALLYETVKRGRMNLEPPQVNEQGAVRVTGAGSAVLASNRWLREAFPAASTQPPSDSAEEPITPSATPEYLLDVALDELDARVDAVVVQLRAAESVLGEDGTTLIKSAGVDTPRVRTIRTKLARVNRKLSKYELIWQMANSDLADEFDSDDDVTEFGVEDEPA